MDSTEVLMKGLLEFLSRYYHVYSHVYNHKNGYDWYLCILYNIYSSLCVIVLWLKVTSAKYLFNTYSKEKLYRYKQLWFAPGILLDRCKDRSNLVCRPPTHVLIISIPYWLFQSNLKISVSHWTYCAYTKLSTTLFYLESNLDHHSTELFSQLNNHWD